MLLTINDNLEVSIPEFRALLKERYRILKENDNDLELNIFERELIGTYLACDETLKADPLFTLQFLEHCIWHGDQIKVIDMRVTIK